MTAWPKEHESERYFTPEEYLAFEETSDCKHEYEDGYVYAMAGADLDHNYVATNIVGDLMVQLRGKQCASFGSDKRLEITISRKTYFYYPDVTVDCSAKKGNHTVSPTVLIEVLSPSTRRKDRVKKLERYRTLSSLRVYAMVEKNAAAIVVHRRAANGSWQEENIAGLDATLALPEIECSLPLRVIYDRVEFAATQS